jgi:uncharacterized spore protein YtfJ
MDAGMNNMQPMLERSQRQAEIMMERFLAAANVNAVFGQPVVSGDYTVITVAEVMGGGGFGSGMGSGPAQGESPAAGTAAGEPSSMGGGAGGGGGSVGRPVAAVVIGPQGVSVKPIIDVGKLGIAGITAWGSMVVFLARVFGRRR